MSTEIPTLHIEGEEGWRLTPFIESTPTEVYNYVAANPSLPSTAFWARSATTVAAAERLLRAFGEQAQTGEYCAFAVREAEGTIIGTSSIYQLWGKTLLEYSVAEDYRCQGVATRATSRVIEFGKKQWENVTTVGFEIHPSNGPSKAVARKLDAHFVRLTMVDMGFGNSQEVEYWEKTV